MHFTTICGLVAMVLVQGSTLFQIVKFYRSKRTEGVSVGFWWTILIGLILYLVYAISIEDPLYITSNTIGVMLTGTSIGMYYYYLANETMPDIDDVMWQDELLDEIEKRQKGEKHGL
jgi:uncharacterized protein with PQ loop repeat